MINKRFKLFKKKISGLMKRISPKSTFRDIQEKKSLKSAPTSALQFQDSTVDNNISKKNVLMFGWELPPFNSGGLGVACHDMAKAITKQNAKVTFVLPKKQASTPDFMKVAFADGEAEPEMTESNSNISYRQVDSILSPYLNYKSYKNKLSQFKKIFGINEEIYGNDLLAEVLRYGKSAAKVAEEETFDVIHAHDWLSFPAGVMAKRVSKKPLVVHVHALEYDRCQEQSVDPRIVAIERWGMKKADKVIAISNCVKDRIMKYYHIPEYKIEVVHNGITIKAPLNKKVSLKSLKSGGKKMILSVGRITYQKGLDYLITATAKAISKNPKIILMIVGSGDMQNQIIQQAASLGISDKVFFPGFLRNEDLDNMYTAADLFVMPSVSEPFGLVALEAMGYKVPVIVSKQSGCAEVIDHALKVDFWDTDELANQMVSVINFSSLRKSLSMSGYHDAEKCTWDKAATKCLKIYEGLATV